MLLNKSLEGIFDSRLQELNLNQNHWFQGLNGSSLSFLLQSIVLQTHKNLIVIASDKERAAYILNDLDALLPKEKVLFFPETYKQPYQIEKTTNANIQERAEVLNLLSKDNFKGVVVTYPQALSEKVTLKKQLHQNTLQIKKNEKLSIEFISEFLSSYNFEHVDFVFEPGQFSIRGGIIDVYSFANEYPYRIELFGNDVEAIKTFDPSTQLSTANFDFVTIIPNINSALFNEDKALLFNYFDKADSMLVMEDANYMFDVFDKKLESARKAYNNQTGEVKQVPPEKLFSDSTELKFTIKGFPVIEFGISSLLSSDTLKFNQRPQPSFNKNFELLISNLKENKTRGYKNYFLTDNVKQADRLITIFNDLLVKEHRTYDTLIDYLPINIHEGFIDEDLKIAIYTDHQIFERYHRFKLKEAKHKNAEAFTIKELLTLNPGDYVTHIDHGIGRFAGLHKLNINGKEQESVKLLFRDNDTLYVSIHSLHRISKYSGKEGQVPRIDKLGSTTWQTLKAKTKRNVKELAYDLIKLYAQRKTKPGHPFPKDNYLQHELEASFIYEDTPDQIKVTRDVKRDMERSHPMDRLVCGDVGFGKTEIAVRAAFKAVCDSKQVAVLVPTTILAYQHYKTFKERLRDLPCTVEYINRFRSAKDQKEIFKRLSEGKIDILIGTHKLVSKDVKFKDLGLLIIDEEQKFGVGVKDKLKTFKANIDTLTLTATPIPRTLQFSLMGARDLSAISTPPPNRYPVQTELHTFDEELIRDAISYELQRGGQVFFVNNKVGNITEVAGILQRLVPDARIAIGHGQMPGDKLEDVMLGFMEGDYDILVATTIIESGLDISNANTIIINDAQNFGLSDLHQMRGRVGRSNKKAFCYLLAPSQILLTSEARKRLKAIVDFSDLGSGFQIAMRDLDIRGAGNLLGGEQSGFINDMGFDTYMKILNEAVEELKEEDWYKDIVDTNQVTDNSVFSRQFVKETVVDTDLQLLIPDAYVSSLTERLMLYRELDNITKEEDLVLFEKNLRDRFGPIPAEAIELINVVRLRWKAMRLGFEKLTLKNKKMLAYFLNKQQSDYFSSPMFQASLMYAQKYPNLCTLKEQNNKLYLTIEDVDSVKRSAQVLSQIEDLIQFPEVPNEV
ncbi:transcription-repair coupling factor [Sphingobacteriaceae bacterium]|nr:transcription-repair coupling factor [Sphingobacteriaceae bacterium]